jgi:hypothetical protein
MRLTAPAILAAVLVLPPSATAQSKPSPQVDGARTVLAALVKAAQDNAGQPARQRKDGDELTVLYFRTAAEAAGKLRTGAGDPGAFLLALGVGLDDSTLLRGNPVVARLWRQVETDEERQARLKVLGKPTMRQRYDWTQHFVVSCALTEALGAALAETAGLLKEQLDARPGGSGFSFADLSADLAGIAFASRVKKGDLSLEMLTRRFEVKAYLPDPMGLREGLSAEQFARDFGSLEDERFKKELAGIRKRVDQLYGK